ncbi:MAG: tRNA pseudouridine(38-40) synthase TruA [Bacteroidota bacterium]
MKRFFFDVSYDGTNYHGWQRQENAISVQQMVEEALSTVLRSEISIIGSGRTDTGVHCEQQFFHADLNHIDTKKLHLRLNSLLPKDIGINAIFEVRKDAHARFDAVQRTYQYRIHTKKNPFLRQFSYYYRKPIDLELMNEASTHLLGQQDFKSFSKVKTEVNNFTCHITLAKWTKMNEDILFEISANRFLRGMVRAIVGTLFLVGEEKISLSAFREVILAKDRRMAGAAAPAHGLFLTGVSYPKSILWVK